MRYLRRLATAMAAFASLPAVGSAMPIPPLTWHSCPESWVGPTNGSLGDRLQCGTLQAPLDHLAQDTRRIDVGVVRVRAAMPTEREGVILFNTGGPGSHPGRLLRSIGEAWTGMGRTLPDERDKRLLADRYDFAAVVPRGLVGSGDYRCVTGLPSRHAYLPTHLDDANWQLLEEDAQAAADACRVPAEARFLNTEQHVHDMDLLRRALGDEKIHFYGISYGGMVGAWYASLYPVQTGRLLLDSSMDFMHGYRAATLLTLAARHREFLDDAVTPVLHDTVRYGLGNSAATVATKIDTFPARPREAWTGQLTTPSRLAAALRMAEWLEDDRTHTAESMTRLIDRARYSDDLGLDRRIRWEAGLLNSIYFAAPSVEPYFYAGPQGDSVRLAMGCNDENWSRSTIEVRESARRNASRYFNYTGDDALEEITCLRWGGPRARRPDLSVLRRANTFLLIQSEKDTSTPLGGGSHLLAEYPNARMLLLRGSRLHGAFNFTTSPCVERTAARYLLTGDLPVTPSRAFSCDEAFGNPADALPGSNATTGTTTTTEPVPTAAPVVPVEHHEF